MSSPQRKSHRAALESVLSCRPPVKGGNDTELNTVSHSAQGRPASRPECPAESRIHSRVAGAASCALVR